MYDADAIEAINFEQLATATDRLLLRGRRGSQRRSSSSVRSTQRHYEPTAIIRRAPDSRAHVFAVTVVIPTLVGVALGLAALL